GVRHDCWREPSLAGNESGERCVLVEAAPAGDALSQCVERNRSSLLTKSSRNKILSLYKAGNAPRKGESGMRSMIFGATLLAVAFVTFHSLISASLVAAQDAKQATFSERFAPVHKSCEG